MFLQKLEARTMNTFSSAILSFQKADWLTGPAAHHGREYERREPRARGTAQRTQMRNGTAFGQPFLRGKP